MGVNLCCCSKIDSQAIKTLNEEIPILLPKAEHDTSQSPTKNLIKSYNSLENPQINQLKSLENKDFAQNFLNTEQNELEETLKKAFCEKKEEELIKKPTEIEKNSKIRFIDFKKNKKKPAFSDLNKAKINLVKIYGTSGGSLVTLLSMGSRDWDQNNYQLVRAGKEYEGFNELPP